MDSRLLTSKDYGKAGLSAISRFLTTLPETAKEWPRQAWDMVRLPADIVLGGTPEEKALQAAQQERAYRNILRNDLRPSLTPLSKATKEQQYPLRSPERTAHEVSSFLNPVANAVFAPRQALSLASSPMGRATLGGLAALMTGVGDISPAIAAAGVIKPKGGNWLNRELTDYLSPLKVSGTLGAHGPEDLAAMTGISLDEARASWNSDSANASKTAINRWIEGPLTKYTKTHLGTPEDPLLKLADEGVSHLNMQQLLNPDDWIRRTASAHRKYSNLPQPSLGGHAQGWSDLADALVRPQEAESLTHVFGKYYPDIVEREGEWLNRIDPKSQVYSFHGDESPWHLGYDHLIDELKNAISHDSDLPEHLRLKPEDLTQMGMEKAVRHVDAINKWREVGKAEANLAKSQNPATHIFKEYPDNNPKGLHWVELKRADLPEGWTSKFDEDSRIWRGYDAEGKVIPELGAGQSPEEVLSSYTYEDLEKALKYEGDMMGHCVGGYCDDVSQGLSRIFSLRDAKGEPHVTIEASPVMSKLSGDTLNDIYPGIWDKIVDEGGHRDLHKWVRENKPEVVDMMSIMQIKGKANKAPIDEYVPFVQDFVKSQPWGEVRDLRNAQMWKHPKTGQYHTMAETEADEALQAAYDSRNLDDVGGYAEGGKVPTREEYLQQLGITFQD